MNDPCLTRFLAELIHEVRESRKDRQHQFEWIKSHFGCATKNDLERMEQRIMATQSEIVADLKTANTQLRKLITDTAGIQPAVDELKAKIVELEALVAAGGEVTPELVEAVSETKSLAQAVDDNVPELPTPPVQ